MSNFELVNSALEEAVIDEKKAYMIDFSKLNSVNDLILILSAMGISFPGNHPFIQQLKPFLNMDNPIDIEQLKKEQNGRK